MSKNVKKAAIQMNISGPVRMGAALLAAVMMLSACSQDISQTLPPLTSTTESAAEPQTEVTTPADTTTTTTAAVTSTAEFTTTSRDTETSPDETPEPVTETKVSDEAGEQIVETYKTYVFSDEYNDFISKCVFVGDSICSGFKAYEILPSSQVVAQGNVAARNIFDFTFKVNGSELSVLPALVDLKPEYVVFSMGMNDVNMTSQEAYCENYGELLSQVETFLPDATLIVCSVTPVLSTSNFTSNENIDSFNDAVKEYLEASGKWYYADISHELKNSLNGLKTDYNGGDGIHLAPDAYKAILYQLCERMVDGKIYNADGTFTLQPDEGDDADTEDTQDEQPEDTDDGDLLSGVVPIDDEG